MQTGPKNGKRWSKWAVPVQLADLTACSFFFLSLPWIKVMFAKNWAEKCTFEDKIKKIWKFNSILPETLSSKVTRFSVTLFVLPVKWSIKLLWMAKILITNHRLVSAKDCLSSLSLWQDVLQCLCLFVCVWQHYQLSSVQYHSSSVLN